MDQPATKTTPSSEEFHTYGDYLALERSARYRRAAVLGELIASAIVRVMQWLGRPRVRRNDREAYS